MLTFEGVQLQGPQNILGKLSVSLFLESFLIMKLTSLFSCIFSLSRQPSSTRLPQSMFNPPALVLWSLFLAKWWYVVKPPICFSRCNPNSCSFLPSLPFFFLLHPARCQREPIELQPSLPPSSRPKQPWRILCSQRHLPTQQRINRIHPCFFFAQNLFCTLLPLFFLSLPTFLRLFSNNPISVDRCSLSAGS
jgi:hypothetical protein